MRDYGKFYIGGEWVQPTDGTPLDVINPATEQVAGRITLGTAADVDRSCCRRSSRSTRSAAATSPPP